MSETQKEAQCALDGHLRQAEASLRSALTEANKMGGPMASMLARDLQRNVGEVVGTRSRVTPGMLIEKWAQR